MRATLDTPWYARSACTLQRPCKLYAKFLLVPVPRALPFQRCSPRRESHPDAAVDLARYDLSDSHAPASLTVR